MFSINALRLIRFFVAPLGVLLISAPKSVGSDSILPQTTQTLRVPLDFRELDRVGSLKAVCRYDGVLWVGTDSGLYRYDRGGKLLAEPACKDPVNCLLSAQGALWVGTHKGLIRQSTNQFHLILKNHVLCLASTGKVGQETVWIGVVLAVGLEKSTGLYRWEQGAATPSKVPELEGRSVYDLAVDGESLWIGSDGFRSGFPTMSGLFRKPVDNASPIHHKDSIRKTFKRIYPFGGALWMVPLGRDANPIRLEPPFKQIAADLRAIGTDASFCGIGETLWIGTSTGLYRWRTGWEEAKHTNLVFGKVNALRQDSGGLWVVSDRELVRIDRLHQAGWAPTITVKQEPGWFNIPATPLFLAWKAENLTGRTTAELIRYSVRVKDTGTGAILPDHGKVDLPSGRSDYIIGTLNGGAIFKRYNYEIVAYDLDDQPSVVKATGVFRVYSDYTIVFAALLFVTTIAGFVWVLVSAPLRRWFLVKVFGYRYSLVPGYCPNEVFVRRNPEHGAEHKYVLYYRTNSSLRLPVSVNADDFKDGQKPQEVNEQRAELAEGRLLALVDNDDFDQPWALRVGDEWSREGGLIAGQVLLGTGSVPAPSNERVHFGVVGCMDPYGHRPPKGPFANKYLESLKNVAAAARKVGKVVSREEAMADATPEDLLEGLRKADIFFFFGHGDHDRLYFAKPNDSATGVVTSEEISALKEVRCRLMILAACNTAATGLGAAATIARALVNHGVNVIAATDLISPVFMGLFFPELYRQLLPTRGPTTGSDLAEAIRAAMKEVIPEWEKQRNEPEFNEPKESDKKFLLLGEPGLKVALV